MIYQKSLTGSLVCSGILKGMGLLDTDIITFVTNSTNAYGMTNVTVYGGVQPAAATIAASWATYNTSFLFHQPSIYLLQSNYSTYAAAGKLVKSGTPTAVTAANTGTATWAIVWVNGGTAIAAGTAAGQISNATIPSTQFIVCPVTTTAAGTGFVLLSSTSITSGVSSTVDNFNIRFSV